MKQTELDAVKLTLKKYLDGVDTPNYTVIADKVIEDGNDAGLSHRTIRRYLSLLYQELNEDSINIDEQDDESFITEVDFEDIDPPFTSDLRDIKITTSNQSDYTIKYSGVQYSFSKRLVDKIFLAYSRKGLNLSSPIIKQIFDINEKEFRAISSKFDLTKESEPYTNDTVSSMTSSELGNYLKEITNEVLEVYSNNDHTVTSQLNKSYREAIIKAQNEDLFKENLMKELIKALPKLEVIRTTTKREKNFNINHWLHVIIPDMHIGLEQSNYNEEIITNQLNFINGLIDSADAGNVVVHFLGDIIDSVSGMNHKDSWKSLTKGFFGADAIIRPYNILLNFLSNINNLEHVNFVGGNHDRLSSDKKEENTGEGAKLIAFMLENSLMGIKVNFDPNIIIDTSDPDLNFILLHGDNAVDGESAQNISWEFGDSNKFNMIYTAHKHTRRIDPKNDGLKFRKKQMPGFCPLDDRYGKRVALPSLPGIEFCFANESGLPITMDIPLKYD